MKTWRADDGHSLPDLLVATAILGLVMAGLLGILQSGTTGAPVGRSAGRGAAIGPRRPGADREGASRSGL